MDAIEALDWGAYSDFTFKSGKYPFVVPVMQAADYLSGYVAVTILLLVALMLFLVQGRRRAAVVALVSLVVAVALIQSIRFLVPRPRPGNAAEWLGPNASPGSYPAAGVFLFILTMILLGRAIWSLTPNRKLRSLFSATGSLLTVWVCMSQFFLALHFLTDIIGGLTGAMLVGWIASKFMDGKDAETASVPPPAADAIQDLSRRRGIQEK